jgi:hypothetical protein
VESVKAFAAPTMTPGMISNACHGRTPSAAKGTAIAGRLTGFRIPGAARALTIATKPMQGKEMGEATDTRPGLKLAGRK